MTVRLVVCALLVSACLLLPLTGCEAPPAPGPSSSGTTGASQ